MYKIVETSTANDLTLKVNNLLEEGWETVGSHQVVIKHSQNRFAGSMYKDTVNTFSYTQTMVKKD
jgi:hypothetical protein